MEKMVHGILLVSLESVFEGFRSSSGTEYMYNDCIDSIISCAPYFVISSMRPIHFSFCTFSHYP